MADPCTGRRHRSADPLSIRLKSGVARRIRPSCNAVGAISRFRRFRRRFYAARDRRTAGTPDGERAEDVAESLKRIGFRPARPEDQGPRRPRSRRKLHRRTADCRNARTAGAEVAVHGTRSRKAPIGRFGVRPILLGSDGGIESPSVQRSSEKPRVSRAFRDGASRARTDDLLIANQALSQLSYSPRSSEFNADSADGFGPKWSLDSRLGPREGGELR